MGRKKKEKITYYDDGRTIADMSALRQGSTTFSRIGTTSRVGDIIRTYWDATKMMLLPTAAICGGLGLLYALAYVIFCLAG